MHTMEGKLIRVLATAAEPTLFLISVQITLLTPRGSQLLSFCSAEAAIAQMFGTHRVCSSPSRSHTAPSTLILCPLAICLPFQAHAHTLAKCMYVAPEPRRQP